MRLSMVFFVFLSVKGTAQDQKSNELYYLCTHKLSIGVPRSQKPTYNITGGTLVRTSNAKELNVFPNKLGKLHITISTRRPKKVTHKDYKVVLAPKPIILLTDAWSDAISEKNQPKYTDKLMLIIKAQKDFAAKYPKEATYRCQKTVCSLLRNGQVIQRFTFSTNKINLKQLGIKAGDKISVSTQIQRINSRGIIEAVTAKNPTIEYTFK